MQKPRSPSLTAQQCRKTDCGEPEERDRERESSGVRETDSGRVFDRGEGGEGKRNGGEKGSQKLFDEMESHFFSMTSLGYKWAIVKNVVLLPDP